MLVIAEEFTAAAQDEIFFRQEKAILDLAHQLHPELGDLILIIRVEDAVSLRLPAPDTATKLMQLRKAEAIGSVDEHDGGIGYIDADFDDGCGDEELLLSPMKGLHDRLFLAVLHPPMDKAHGKHGKYAVTQLFIHGDGRGEVLLLTLFDERTDHVHLMSRFHFPSHEIENTLEHLTPDGVSLHRMSSRRHPADG